MHRSTRAPVARTIHPEPRAVGAPATSLEALAASLLVSADDLPLEIEDLAAHFLCEATQSDVPSSAPRAEVAPASQGEGADLREEFFDGVRDRARLREFERIWHNIISRELVSTEL